MLNLIAIGDALIDTHVFIDNATLECDLNQQNCQLCLNYATKIPITHSFQALGGNAANVATIARNLGLSTALVASIGKDATGNMIKEELKKQKVSTSLLHIDKQTPTRYAVVLNFKQERTILSYHQKRNYTFPKKLPTTDWIYYTSMSEGYEKLQQQFLKYIRTHKNIKVAYNPGSLQIQHLPLVKQVIAQSDILILNREEALLILQKNSNDNSSLNSLIKELLSLGAKEVVITDSHKGAWAGDTTGTWQCDSFPVRVASKTGAGDAFSAGYLSARFHHKSISDALIWGIGSSAHIISNSHTTKATVNKKEMMAIISQFASIKPASVL